MPKKKANKKLPSFDELLIPTVKALKELGGSGSVDEINTKVYEIADISVLVLC
jgi:restriction system protein